MDLKPWVALPRTKVLFAALLFAGALGMAVLFQTDSPPPASSTSSPSAGPDARPSSGPTTKPTPGSLKPVRVEEVTPERPRRLTEAAPFGKNVTLRIVDVAEVQGKARGPGQISGPAVRMKVRLTNGSSRPVSLEQMVVAVASGKDRAPAAGLTDPASQHFEGVLKPGRSVTGVYVFSVPAGDRDQLEVTVSSSSDVPVVVFQGSAGRAR